MKTILQTFRRPAKSVLSIIMVSVTTTMLLIGIGQAYTAQKTEETIQEIFTTIALPVDRFGLPENSNIRTLPKEIAEWIKSLPEQYPNQVVTLHQASLASVYIPQLRQDNFTNHPHPATSAGIDAGVPNTSAILEINISEIGTAEPAVHWYYTASGIASYEYGYRVIVQGTIVRALALEEGYKDPAGYSITVTLDGPTEEYLRKLQLNIGDRYLVYSDWYGDNDWALRSNLFHRYGGEFLQAFDDNSLTVLSQKEVESSNGRRAAIYNDGFQMYILSQGELENFHRIRVTVDDMAAMPQRQWITGEDGFMYPVILEDYFIYNENGELVQVTAEEYRARYSVPTIVKLDGTAEEFLASQEGAQWRQMAENIQINSHAFPIIGVDSLGYIAEFARENARIVAGRDFTPEELSTGARVCILSESLASANGIQVGDTLECRFYDYDISSPYQNFIHEGFQTVNPSAYFYGATTPFHAEAEGYVVIGLYRQSNEWGDTKENSYTFTPNTIFVPNQALTCKVDHADTGMFQTLVLRNGALTDFVGIVSEAGYDGLFTYHDQGYSALEDSFLDYRESATMALRIGLGLYGVGLLAVLLLFPLSQRKNLKIMSSLGATRKQRIGHVLLQTMSILVPGTVLGFGAGSLLWNDVMEALTVSAGLSFSLQLDGGVLLAIAVLQLAVAFALTLLTAILLTGEKTGKRR